MTLYEPLPTTLEWRGKRIRLNLSFDSVIRMNRALECELDDASRYRMALLMVVYKRDVKKLRGKPLKEVVDILSAIITGFTQIPARKGAIKEPVFDLDQDITYIIAAFRQAYGIDLYAEVGKMDWRVFLSLLAAIPDDTLFSKICDIRTREIPAPTKHNGKEINALLKAKTFWALWAKGQDEENFQAGIDKFAAMLIGMAKAGVKRG